MSRSNQSSAPSSWRSPRAFNSWGRFVPGVFAIGLSLTLAGCGDSREDLFKKHASRSRSPAEPDQAEPVPAPTADPVPKQASVNPVAQQAVAVEAAPTLAAARSAEPDAAAMKGTSKRLSLEELADRVGIRPVSERKPDVEWTVAQRRRRSYDNLMKINAALESYLDRHQKFPRSHRVNAGGIPTLSWRVELLPYLGYQDLYDQFDLSRGWDMSPNKQLLEFIPDEFVSPERFDEKTNYLLPTESTFVFGDNRALAPKYIDDGPENTLMLIEVNDRKAVSWTEPADFKPKYGEDLAPWIGKLRADGTFALWANGYPVLLEAGLSNAQVYSALTFKKGEGLKASDIHRKITFAEAEEDPGSGESLPDSIDQNGAAIAAGLAASPGATPGVAVPQEIVFQRDPVPSRPDLTAAQQKLRVIFRDKIEAADSSNDKAKLAGEMLVTADEIEADVSGAYVLQEAALKLAVEAGDATVLIKAIDSRVAKYEVNAFEENLKWIQALGQVTASRDAASVNGSDLLNRSVPVIYAGIRDDQYMQAGSVARIAGRYAGKDRAARLLTRLRSQLGSAKREYDKSVTNLNRFRSNPEDVLAGASFGTFLCFIKGDWETGLPLIAGGAQGDLAEVAAMDLRGARRSVDQVAQGDAWWELSRRGSGVYRQGAQDRAVTWYRAALERLPQSLDRIHVKNRLQEAGETDGRSPIALCVQLADELGIDLSASLTSIAVSNGRTGHPGFEEDD